MRVLVVDGQGGGIGAALTGALVAAGVRAQIVAAGTNAYAAAAMRKAGAQKAVCGERETASAIASADIICGPVGMVMAGSLKGEVSDVLASEISKSAALKVLIPLNKCSTVIVGTRDTALKAFIDEAVEIIKAALPQK